MNLILKRVSLLILLFLAGIFLLVPKSFAVTPVQGSWTLVGLSGYGIHSFTVDPNNPNILYAGTAGLGIFKSTDGGNTWNAINNGITNYGGYFTEIIVDPTNSNILYAGGVSVDDGSTGILKSTDGGASWTYAHNGITDVGFGGPPRDVHSMIMDPSNHNILYAAIGTRCGSVYKTTDGAGTWTRGIGLACDPSVVRIDPSNSNVLYTRTGWGQGIDKSTDGGVNWSNISTFGTDAISVYGLAIDPFNPNNLYANSTQGNSNGLFKSTDGGLNWTLSNSNTYSIYKAVFADPVRPNTVYAGDDGGVDTSAYVTTDGGSTWTNITSNLPNIGVKKLFVPANNPNLLYTSTDSGIYVYGLTPTQTTPQLTSLDPAKVWVGLSNSQDKGIKYDLKAEAYVGNTLVTSGELDSVDSGGAGFNNANLNSIAFNSFSPVDFPSGSTLNIKLYVRNACVGSKNNGKTARLWYNDSQANSGFGATIGGNQTSLYLVSNSSLSTSVGTGPKLTSDVDTKTKCAPFKSFGTWSVTP